MMGALVVHGFPATKNGNTRKRWEIYLKLTIKSAAPPQWRRSGVLLLNVKIFHNFSSFDFEQANNS